MNFGYGSVCMKSMVAQTTNSRKAFIMQAMEIGHFGYVITRECNKVENFGPQNNQQ